MKRPQTQRMKRPQSHNMSLRNPVPIAQTKRPQAKAVSGFARYTEAILDLGRDRLTAQGQDPQLEKVLRNSIFGLPGPKKLSPRLTPDEDVFSSLLHGHIEIYQAFERLKDAEFYIRQFPNSAGFKRRGISRTKYLRYHIEKYLEDVYVFYQRLLGYLKVVARRRKIPEKTLNDLKKVIEKSFEGIVGTRGRHIHQRRYDDDDLEGLELLELLLDGATGKERTIYLNVMKNWRYPEIRRKWKGQIRDNNAQILKLLDFYFDIVYKLIFPDGRYFRLMMAEEKT